MLVLTRRVGEEIVIDGNIRLKVVMVKGQTTRLGITAPPSVRVLRMELIAEGAESARPLTNGLPVKSQGGARVPSESPS